MGTQPRQGFERVEPKKKISSGHAETCAWRFGMNAKCDCGAVPEHEYIDPTNEQLANFSCIQTFGPGFTKLQTLVAISLLESSPEIREVWLALHRQFQEAAWRLSDGNS